MSLFGTIFTTTWSDVTVPVYDKRYGDQPESGTSAAGQATVYYLVDWTNRWTFVRTVMGSPNAADFSNPSVILRRLPLQYADNPAFYALQFDITPVASPTGVCAAVYNPETAYRYAWVGVQYGTLPYAAATMYTVETKTGSERVTIPDTCYSFVSDGLIIKQDVGVSITNQVKQITYHNVPSFDDSQFISYQDTVNATTFFNYPAGSLLFQPVQSSYSSSIGTGSPLYEVTMSFAWRSQPWNYCQRPDTGVWAAVQDPDGNPIYASSEFNDLLN